MKPTPTPEMIEAAAKKQFELHHLTRWETASDEERSSHLFDAQSVLSAALSAKPAAAVVGERDGWKLVPIEPTPEMIDAGRIARWNIEGGYGGPSSWEAMLAAAPPAPDGWQPDAGLQWHLDRIGEEIAAGRKQNALAYLSFAFAETSSELDRMRRELAEVSDLLKDPAAVRINYLRGEIACQSLIDEARAGAFREAAAVAELDADWSAFGKKNLEPWDTGPDTVRDYRLGIVAGRAIAAAIRAKAEETRT
ncbi:MAG TPA: hypothetical protein VGO04_12645 [Ensifer sp.]|jgi:hypothetical protein|uniref:hypothetical protein n=1 Tax=Ensifer sp. TaxID=1872086 RepID=UPI002E1140EF|nr:hypothetical protein [Ensifer sp.]